MTDAMSHSGILNRSIESLWPSPKGDGRFNGRNVRTRALNVLFQAGVVTVEDLLAFEPRQLKKHRNCGKLVISELQKILASKGVQWGGPPSETRMTAEVVKGLRAVAALVDCELDSTPEESFGDEADHVEVALEWIRARVGYWERGGRGE